MGLLVLMAAAALLLDSEPAPGATLRGRVVAAGGALAGADVRLTRLDPDLGALSYSAMRATLTDASGAFEFVDVQPGSWLLDARDATRLLPFPMRIVLKPDRPSPGDYELVLEPAATIEGKVTDESGAPLAGVGVAVGDGGLQGLKVDPVAVVDSATGAIMRLPSGLSYPRLPLALAHTGADGRFKLAPVLPTVKTSIRVGGLPEYHDKTVNGIGAAPGKTAWVDVALRRGAAILGRALQEDGRPSKGAKITLRALEVQPVADSWIVLTRTGPGSAQSSDATHLFVGDEGLFRFDGLNAGRYLVTAEQEGCVRVTSPVLLVSDAGQVVSAELVLREGTAIRGRVTDSAGRALPGATVEIVADPALDASLQAYLEPQRVEVDGDGAFEVLAGSDAPVQLRIEAPGRPSLTLPRVTAAVSWDVPLARASLARPIKGAVPQAVKSGHSSSRKSSKKSSRARG